MEAPLFERLFSLTAEIDGVGFCERCEMRAFHCPVYPSVIYSSFLPHVQMLDFAEARLCPVGGVFRCSMRYRLVF